MTDNKPSKSTDFSLYPLESHPNNMHGACVYEEKTVIHELTQGIQMAKQLRVNLHSPETIDHLIQKILSSYDKALFGLQSGNPSLPAAGLLESSMFTPSPGSEVIEFNQPFSIQQDISKKRKRSTTWEDQVRIHSNNGLEDNTDDGYNWRKYGQKEISGSKFPRSYYRCSYPKVEKCLATKQVKRSDEDPTVFEIAYKGKHTCSHGTQSASPPPPPSPEKHEITPSHQHHQLSPPLPNSDELLSDLRANMSMDTMGLYGDTVQSSFSFPSTSLIGLMDDLQKFDVRNHYDNGLWPVYSPPYISPGTSESGFFTEWGSSSSLNLLADFADLDPDFV